MKLLVLHPNGLLASKRLDPFLQVAQVKPWTSGLHWHWPVAVLQVLFKLPAGRQLQAVQLGINTIL